MILYNVREDLKDEFRLWLAKLEPLIPDHAPPGWSYGGTFMIERGNLGFRYASFWEMREGEDFTDLNEYEDEMWQQVLVELGRFIVEPDEELTLRKLGDRP